MGSKISEHSGEPLETQFLFQWVSMLIQRFNSILYHETILADEDTDTYQTIFNFVFNSRDLYYQG